MTEHLELREAQLFRLLCQQFGKDRVIVKASISLICGDNLPCLPIERYPRYLEWASEHRCLCTVLNNLDDPRMVVEFFSGFSESIDPVEAEREQYLPTVLRLRNIWYVKVSDREFDQMLSSDGSLTFLQLVERQIGDEVFVE